MSNNNTIETKSGTGFRETQIGESLGEDARLWAQLVLADLPIYWTYHPGKRVRKWKSEDGRKWREPGTIAVDPFGTQRFRVHVYGHTNVEDYQFLINIARLAQKNGLNHAWEEFETTDSTTAWSYRWSRQVKTDDRRTKMHFCMEPACQDVYHAGDYLYHLHDEILVEQKTDPYDHEGYHIKVTRRGDQDLWAVDVHTDGFYGLPDDAASFANDIQWMAATARKLNEAPESIRSSKLVLPCESTRKDHAACAVVA